MVGFQFARVAKPFSLKSNEIALPANGISRVGFRKQRLFMAFTIGDYLLIILVLLIREANMADKRCQPDQ